MRARCPTRLIGLFTAICRWSVALGWLALTVSAPSLAQTPGALPLAGEALTHSRDGAVEGCGLRLTGGEATSGDNSLWVDLSVNVYRRGIALVQAIAYEIDVPRYEPKDTPPQRVPVQRAWVKPQAAERSTRLGENVDVRETLVYRITFEDATALFEAVASEQPVAVGVRPWGRPRETIVSGPVTLRGDTRARIADCLTALVN